MQEYKYFNGGEPITHTDRLWIFWCTFAFHYLKASEFIVSVHNQLCLVSIHSNQDHVLWIIFYVATNKLIGGSICKELVAEKKKNRIFFTYRSGYTAAKYFPSRNYWKNIFDLDKALELLWHCSIGLRKTQFIITFFPNSILPKCILDY